MMTSSCLLVNIGLICTSSRASQSRQARSCFGRIEQATPSKDHPSRSAVREEWNCS